MNGEESHPMHPTKSRFTWWLLCAGACLCIMGCAIAEDLLPDIAPQSTDMPAFVTPAPAPALEEPTHLIPGDQAAQGAPTISLHTLWGIPFGITREACVAMVGQAVGITLEPSDEADRLTLEPRQRAQLLGIPAEVDAWFSQADALIALRVRCLAGEYVALDAQGTPALEPVLDLYDALASALQAAFGMPTGGTLQTVRGSRQTQYYYPQKNGAVDRATVQRAAQENDSIVVGMDYGNIGLGLGISQTDDGIILEGLIIQALSDEHPLHEKRQESGTGFVSGEGYYPLQTPVPLEIW